VLAYSLSLYFFMTDAVDIYFTLAFVVVAFGFGILMSTFSLILEELTFRTYTSKRALLVLIFTAVLENFGYRQINSWWRVRGLWQWLRGRKHNWGAMKRVGSINSP